MGEWGGAEGILSLGENTRCSRCPRHVSGADKPLLRMKGRPCRDGSAGILMVQGICVVGLAFRLLLFWMGDGENG